MKEKQRDSRERRSRDPKAALQILNADHGVLYSGVPWEVALSFLRGLLMEPLEG